MDKKLGNKVASAAKWSAITEIVARLIVPVTSMVLARLLTPEAFGVVATLTMIITFAEIFTDAGFQKYLIQHEFIDEKNKEESTTVAFWSNLALSILIWLIICLCSNSLAAIVGNPGLGYVLCIACISIPLAAFSSIQMALYKRDFDFKTLFRVRLVGICVPIVVTIPLAVYLRSYWALVIGTIVTNLCNAVLLTYFSKWKPRCFYSIKILKEMLSFTIWSMFEAITIWMTGYLDVFLIGIYLNTYYLGIYKTSMTTVGQITGLITTATTPILFSSLSRLQNSDKDFEGMFFKFQKFVGLFVIPLGVGIFCFRTFITDILLGSQWLEASNFIGLWGLSSAITIVLSHYSSEVYRSKGRPKLSVLAQLLHLVVLLPTVAIAVRYGFEVLYIARSAVRLESIIVNLIIMYWFIKISPLKMMANIAPALFASLVMGGGAYLMQGCMHKGIFNDLLSIACCIVIYFITICCFKTERELLMIELKRYRTNRK